MKTITDTHVEENESTEKKLSEYVNKWIKVEEFKICVSQGDNANTFTWCRSDEVYKDN